MKKKKILNIFVSMFIASNLMTNFTYANPVGTETEITNVNETNNDDSNVSGSNDNSNNENDQSDFQELPECEIVENGKTIIGQFVLDVDFGRKYDRIKSLPNEDVYDDII